MFWAYNASPQIDSILCKEVTYLEMCSKLIKFAGNGKLYARSSLQDLTLYELLDQENVLQELKAQNLKLIEL